MAKRRRYKYANLDEVPHADLDTIVDLLRAGQQVEAEMQLRGILGDIKELPQYEAFLMARKLKLKAQCGGEAKNDDAP